MWQEPRKWQLFLVVLPPPPLNNEALSTSAQSPPWWGKRVLPFQGPSPTGKGATWQSAHAPCCRIFPILSFPADLQAKVPLLSSRFLLPYPPPTALQYFDFLSQCLISKSRFCETILWCQNFPYNLFISSGAKVLIYMFSENLFLTFNV